MSADTPLNIRSLFGQLLFYCAFAAFVGYFATRPRYEHLPADHALLKLSIAHFGDRECRKRSPEELQKMPPNMRAPMDCPRERSAIALEVDLDNAPLYRGRLEPTGLSGDGIATVYQRFELPAGEHRLAVRMNDNLREVTSGEFKFSKEAVVTLKPTQVLVIDFNPDRGGFFFK